MADSSYGAKAATSPDTNFRTDLVAGVHTPYHKDADRAALLAALSPIATQTTLGAVDTKLGSILSTLQAQQDIAVSLWTDNTNAYFVRRDVIDQDSGVVTVTWTNSTGTAATPGAGLRPVNNEESLQTVSSRFTATSAGTGYSIGDLLERAVVLDLNTSPATVVSSVWVNITTGAVISAPTAGHYAAAPTGLPAGAATEVTLAQILAKIIASPATEATVSAISGKLPATLGPKAAAASLSAALSNDDAARFGAPADPAWTGTGDGSLIAVAKAIATASADTSTPSPVIPAQGAFEVVAESDTDEPVWTGPGAYLKRIIIQPEDVSPGAVTVKDGATTIWTWPGTSGYPSHLLPFEVNFDTFIAGALTITTGPDVAVTVIGGAPV